MRRALPVQLPLAAALAAAARIASAGDVAADILDTIDLEADSLGTETAAALAVECDAAVAGGLAVVGDAVFSNGIARVAPGGGLDAGNPDILWSGREPAWWTAYGVLNGEPPNDEAAATAGQLKWIATRARAMLDDAAWSADGAGGAVSDLVETLPPSSNSLAVAAAELKRIARPFAQRCIELHADCAFSNATAVSAALAPGPRDGEIVTVGQVKRLFDFDLSVDADGNGIPDWWERLHGIFDPDPPGGVPDPARDSDGDGLSDAREYALGTNPVSGDTDEDDLPDAEEVAQGTDPRNPDTDGDGLSDGAEAAWVDRGVPFEWDDLPDAAVLASGGLDDALLTTGTDPFVFAGLTVTNLSIDTNGRLFVRNAFKSGGAASSYANTASSNTVFNSHHAVVAAYWADLRLRPALGSRILAGERNGRRIVRFENVGFSNNATNRVSFQCAIASNAVSVAYAEIADTRPGSSKTTFAAQGPGASPNLWLGVGRPTLPLAGTTVCYRFGTGSSPLLADTDGDGLPDAEEVALGTNPGAADTDRDGLPDGWELAAGLDPLDPTGDNGASGDPDGDGRTNAQERSAGTNPLLADTDGDGIPDGISAYAWYNHSLQVSASRQTNLVIEATASVPPGASAAIRLGTLTVPLTNGMHTLAFHISAGQNYEFRIRCTGGATIAVNIVPPAGTDPPLRDSGEDSPCSDLPGLTLSDPDDAFLGIPLRTALAILSMPAVSLVSTDGLGACVHEISGIRSWNVRIRPGSWSDYADRASFDGFSTDGNGTVSLAVADTSRSVTNGTVLVASTDPRFPPATASAEIHRCEYDPATGGCPLCGETHATTGVSISVTQDYRYALFGTTNMSRFAATVRGGDMDDIVWTVSPALAEGVWLHSLNDPDDNGDFAITGTAQVWADSGLSTNQFTVTAAFPFAPDKSVSKTITTVAIDAEAICTEVDSSGFVVNPISIPIGETATFRVKVFPSSVPNSHIEWRIVNGSGNVQVVGSRYGRELKLRGTAAGDVNLRVEITGYNGPAPMFKTTVMRETAVPVVAWIVCRDDGSSPAVSAADVQTLVEQANILFRQICISCYVHQVSFTNKTEWMDLPEPETPDFSEKFQNMIEVANPTNGIEVHFVNSIGNTLGVNARNNNGMVLCASASAEVFAHETGHAMGRHDIYCWHPDTTKTVTGDVRKAWCPDDWTGNDERGFYPDADSLTQSNLIERLVMCGIKSPGQRDFSWGNVHGIQKSDAGDDGFEYSNEVPIGFFPHVIPQRPHQF